MDKKYPVNASLDDWIVLERKGDTPSWRICAWTWRKRRADAIKAFTSLIVRGYTPLRKQGRAKCLPVREVIRAIEEGTKI